MCIRDRPIAVLEGLGGLVVRLHAHMPDPTVAGHLTFSSSLVAPAQDLQLLRGGVHLSLL
eukprot:975930-Alexandrium_andersonii.AAC.1